MQKRHTHSSGENARVSVGEDKIDLIECANKIVDARNFLQGLFMAADATDREHRSALKIIIGSAIGCLNEARTLLAAAEGGAA